MLGFKAVKKLSGIVAPNSIAVLAIVGILLHLIFQYVAHVPRTAWQIPLIVVLVLGGVPLIVPLTRKLLAGEFGADHLAGISIVTSVLLGEYLVGTIVILMLSGGTALEQFASRRASSVLDQLGGRNISRFCSSGSIKALHNFKDRTPDVVPSVPSLEFAVVQHRAAQPHESRGQTIVGKSELERRTT